MLSVLDYYGSATSQVSKISVPDARTITLQPLKKMLKVIKKSNYGS
jgi:ribosome recycling factor